MDFGKTVSKGFHQKRRFRHAWVNLSSMTNVEAKTSVGQRHEELLKFRNSSPDWFALVHVLDQQPVAKLAPSTNGENCVGMRNDMESLAGQKAKQTQYAGLFLPGKFTG